MAEIIKVTFEADVRNTPYTSNRKITFRVWDPYSKVAPYNTMNYKLYRFSHKMAADYFCNCSRNKTSSWKEIWVHQVTIAQVWVAQVWDGALKIYKRGWSGWFTKNWKCRSICENRVKFRKCLVQMAGSGGIYWLPFRSWLKPWGLYSGTSL